MPVLRLGLIGYGTSGRVVAELVAAGHAGDIALVGVQVRDPTRYTAEARSSRWPFVSRLDHLLTLEPEVVAELAGHEALARYGEDILRSGRTLLTTSAGALGDDELHARLLAAAEDGDGRIILPSGAIAGLDAIESAAVLGLDRVVHVVRKPPRALLPDDEAAAVMASGKSLELYRGPAREATRRFPQNVNVVAMVSMAGIGLDKTEVVVVADPAVEHNTHEVSAEGAFGSIEVRVRNVPSPSNPKTGVIVAGSVVRSLRRLRARVVVGG